MRVSQKTFLEPLKKFGGEFSGLAVALNSHEQLVQEWKNAAARVSMCMSLLNLYILIIIRTKNKKIHEFCFLI